MLEEYICLRLKQHPKTSEDSTYINFKGGRTFTCVLTPLTHYILVRQGHGRDYYMIFYDLYITRNEFGGGGQILSNSYFGVLY